MKVRVKLVHGPSGTLYPSETLSVVRVHGEHVLVEEETGARHWVGQSFLENVDGSSFVASAYSRAEGQELVAVKPLEWSGEYPEQPGLVAYCVCATNPFGVMGWGYRIDYPSDRSSFHASSSDAFDETFKTMDAAVAACEAHYQQRATDAIRSAQVKAPAPVVPDGWKLVPVEPTEEMKVAAFGPIMAGGRGGPITADFVRQTAGITTYKAMLAAAPSQPLVRGEGE